jgi:ketosteroid isomerase-like protein
VSEENVELHRRAIEVINSRDVEAAIASADPSVEFVSTIAGASYRGHDGVRNVFRDLVDGFGDELRLEPEVFFDLGEQTLAFYVARGRGRQSGAEVVMPQAHVATWRDGLLVYLRAYAHREDALNDLGVSEDALERIAP